MSETKFRNHPKAPHNQPFQLNGKRNSKTNAWYRKGTNNNPKRRDQKED